MPDEHDGQAAQAHGDALVLLRWYVEMGADEAIGYEPVDRFAIGAAAVAATNAPAAPQPAARPPRRPTAPRPVATSLPAAFAELPGEAAQSARLSAARADSIVALEAAIAAFEGCALKQTATNTVVADGNPPHR